MGVNEFADAKTYKQKDIDSDADGSVDDAEAIGGLPVDSNNIGSGQFLKFDGSNIISGAVTTFSGSHEDLTNISANQHHTPPSTSDYTWTKAGDWNPETNSTYNLPETTNEVMLVVNIDNDGLTLRVNGVSSSDYYYASSDGTTTNGDSSFPLSGGPYNCAGHVYLNAVNQGGQYNAGYVHVNNTIQKGYGTPNAVTNGFLAVNTSGISSVTSTGYPTDAIIEVFYR